MSEVSTYRTDLRVYGTKASGSSKLLRSADEAETETGMFEIPAGGRRYRVQELLVKKKRMARTTHVPCIVREDGIAEEESLAKNVQRAPLHSARPVDGLHRVW